jgi:hypothetical protein
VAASLPAQQKIDSSSVHNPAEGASRVLFRCSGQRVSEIDIRPGRPPFGGLSSMWRAAAHSIGLHHATTKAQVLSAFLTMRVGDVCTEGQRAETERVLRAQQFIATAKVTPEPDTANTVKLIVETTDEIPVIIGMSIGGGNLNEVTIGNSNIAGSAISAQVTGKRGGAYRPGFGARVVDFATFYRPWTATLAGSRDPLGNSWEVGLAHPFYTDFQPTGWHVAAHGSDGYYGVQRPADDPLNLRVRRDEWEGAYVGRSSRLLGKFGLLGVVAMGNSIHPNATGVLVTDTGFAPDTGGVLTDRYRALRVGRLGGVLGIRALRFHAVPSFDALSGVQDVATGLQVGTLFARGFSEFGESDILIVTDLYTGTGGPLSFVALDVESEMRRADDGGWDDIVVSGRAAWYLRRGRQVVQISDEFAGGWNPRLPFQLNIGDVVGGVPGYGSSRLVGGVRNIVRVEDRRLLSRFGGRADLAVGAFVDVGSLWAGDAPYGQHAYFRPATGVSLFGAYPAGSRRVYRLDFAVPLGRGAGSNFELRLTTDLHALYFWQEPGDVSRGRLGSVPSSLFTWPRR